MDNYLELRDAFRRYEALKAPLEEEFAHIKQEIQVRQDVFEQEQEADYIRRRTERLADDDGWAECQDQEADDRQECQEEFALSSDGNEEPRRAYEEDYDRLNAASKKGGDKNPQAKTRLTNRGSLGLMREIRPIW